MEPWKTIGSTLLSVASLLARLQADQRKQKEDIRKAISHAFHNTEKYYAYRESGNDRDPEREIDLAKDWEQAAILVEGVDKHLAERLGLKSRYWRDGGTWSDEQVKEAGIQLHRVRAEGMTLFTKAK